MLCDFGWHHGVVLVLDRATGSSGVAVEVLNQQANSRKLLVAGNIGARSSIVARGTAGLESNQGENGNVEFISHTFFEMNNGSILYEPLVSTCAVVVVVFVL